MSRTPPLPAVPSGGNENSLSARVAWLHDELQETTSDFRRLEIRDQARAAAEASKILGRSDIVLAASELVARAERAIVKANPPMKGGRGKTRDSRSRVSGDSIRQMRVIHSRLPDPEFEDRLDEHHRLKVPVTRESLRDGPCAPGMRLRSGRDEWWTPEDIVRRARTALGGIDCDPASVDEANETVGATRFFTRAQDGLQQVWSGRVWLNPPFSAGIVGRFVSKLIVEEAVTAWCCLLNNGTETKWGQKMLARSHVVCFPASRIRFYGPDAKCEGTPLQGQMIFGWWRVAPSEGIARFYEAFSPLGVVLPGGASLAVRLGPPD